MYRRDIRDDRFRGNKLNIQSKEEEGETFIHSAKKRRANFVFSFGETRTCGGAERRRSGKKDQGDGSDNMRKKKCGGPVFQPASD